VTEFSQQLVNGITLGSVYALVALGYTMIFGVLELIAFAQAGVYMVGAFVGLGVASMLGVNWLVALPITLLVASIAGGVLNLGIDRIAYRPIRNAGRLAPLISGIGVYIFLENGAGVWIGLQPKAYPRLLPAGAFTIGGVRITSAQLVMVAVAVVCMALLTWVVLGTETGLAMRAVAERPETSSLLGIEPETVIMITFVLGGVLSAIAGVLVGTYTGVASPTMGFLVGIKAFTAAVIGGIGNIPGALVGGVVVGLLETFGAGYIASAWSDVFVFIVLIAVLMFRPYGLLGAKLPQRA
jgi:branched-chain amino acid transport system permease protein